VFPTLLLGFVCQEVFCTSLARAVCEPLKTWTATD
jgi:hypothetical protein